MPVWTARRRCAAIVADLDVPQPFDLSRFVARVAGRRGRTIFLHPFTSGSGIPCGVWLATARADHIFCETGTSPWHSTHIAVHEIAHILLGHGGASGAQLAGVLAPDVSPALARLILGRSIYSSAEERDAETVASLVLGQDGASKGAAPGMTAQDAAVLGRLEHAWG